MRSPRSRSKQSAGLAVLASFVLAGGAAGESSVTEELLQILRSAGTIDDAKYEELRERARREDEERARAAAEAAQLAAVSAAPAPEGEDPKGWKFKWSNGFKLDRNDGAFKLKFGGRLMNDWAFISEDESLDDALDGEGHGTEFRRARLFFEGTVYERLFFKAQYEFANTGDGRTDLKDLYVGFKGLGPLGSVQVGHFKEPWSLEEQTSSKYLTFMERSLGNAFSPSRNTGVMAQNAVFGKRLFWQVGAFRDTNDQDFGFSDDSDYNVGARLSWVPWYEGEGDRVLHLGFSYSHQFRGDDFTQRYRQRPEAHLAVYYADTGSIIPAHDIDLFTPELALVLGPFSLQAEYVHVLVQSRRNRDDVDFWAAYAEASYFLTGEHRNYEYGKGRFGRVKPAESFNPAKGQWGAFQLAARFSYLDLEDRFVDGGELWDVTAGLNWHLFPNFRVMLNYIHARLTDRLAGANFTDLDADADIAQVRFQIDF